MLASWRQHAWRAVLLGTASCLAVAIVSPRTAGAEVATDGTLGRRVSLRGGDITVGADLGQQRGGNLFHSFQKFGVETKGKVTFTGPDSVRNVIGRVTGGERSSIDGTLASTIPDADLYLLNPAGILFGPNARLDVKGSFHASTADELRLADGAVFSALDPGGSTLSVAEPQAFGFLGATPAGITLDRGVLSVALGKQLSLSASEVTLTAGDNGAASGGPDGRIAAPGGRVTLAGLSQGMLDIQAGTVSDAAGGAVRLAGQAAIDVSGNGGGRIQIRAEDISLEGRARVFANNLGDLDAAAGIDVEGGRLTLSGGSMVAADTVTGMGRGGTVSVTADTVMIAEGAQLRSSTFGPGNAGAVVVAAGRSLTIDRMEAADPTGVIVNSELGSSGAAGSIAITAESVEVRNDGQITTITNNLRPAGIISVTADTVTLKDDGEILSNSQTQAGNSGSITVTARQSLSVVDARIGVSTTRGGNAGSLILRTPNLTLEGAQIRSRAVGGGEAGMVEITTGTDGSLDGSVTITDSANRGSEVSTGTRGGKGGTVVIRTGALSVQGSNGATREGSTSKITSDTEATMGGRASGPAGGVHVDALTVEVGAGARISSDTMSSGDGGTVTIRADAITIADGGQLSSAAFGQGNAGSVVVAAGRSLTIDRMGSATATGVISNSERRSTGAAGSVTITSGSVVVRNDGQITTNTNNASPAGAISVTADTVALSSQGEITSNSQLMSGDAGSVMVTAKQRLSIVDARIGVSSTQGGNAGQIVLETPDLALEGGRVRSRTTSSGNAGSIEIRSDGNGSLVGSVTLASSSLRGSEISTGTEGAGKGGSLTVRTGALSLRGPTVNGEATRITSDTTAAGAAGAIDVKALTVDLGAAARISSNTSAAGRAGDIDVAARQRLIVDGAQIESSSTGAGSGGNVRIVAPTAVVTLKGQGTISASAEVGGGAGDVVVRAGELNAKDGVISTSGGDTAGGRITVVARERIYLRDSEITSSGAFPDINSGASVIAIRAPEIILSRSQVESLTGDGESLAGSGEAEIDGDLTIISFDSEVVASSAVEISGLQTNLGSDLQLPANLFLDASGLLQPSCADRGAARSTFSRGGRGGLPPSPDRPLPSAGAAGDRAPQQGGGRHIPVTLADCGPDAPAAPTS